ncbi:unnamed protein product, partial [marine sediment metagenome]
MHTNKILYFLCSFYCNTMLTQEPIAEKPIVVL